MDTDADTDTYWYFIKIQATDVHECMATDNTMTLPYQNLKHTHKLQMKDYKLKVTSHLAAVGRMAHLNTGAEFDVYECLILFICMQKSL